MDFINKPSEENNEDYEKSPQDNQKFRYNIDDNYINNQNNFQNDNLINNNNDYDLENNVNQNQYPQGIMKDEISPNESQRIEEQERITNNIFKGFLIKVYGILSIQLFITLFFILLFQKDSIKSYFLNRPIYTGFLNLISIISFIGMLFILSVKEDLGRKVPYNYITLLIITLCMSFMCAFFALSYSFGIVFFCILLTIISSVAITAYAYSTDKDFSYIKVLTAVIISQFGGFIFMVFVLNITMLEMVCCLVATLLFGIYLVYDTQVILRKYGEVYTIDDYIFASLQIYLDIVRLFLMILATLGKSSKN